MRQSDASAKSLLTGGYRVNSNSARGWISSSANTSGTESHNVSINNIESVSKTQKSLEDWHKAHYFDYYFKSYKSSGVNDETASLYANSCVAELERSGYIMNVVKTQLSTHIIGSEDKHLALDNNNHFNTKIANKVTEDNDLQNWIQRLYSAYCSNGKSIKDIEWNKKISLYAQHISKQYTKALLNGTVKYVDWKVQPIPKKKTIQEFTPEESEMKNNPLESKKRDTSQTNAQNSDIYPVIPVIKKSKVRNKFHNPEHKNCGTKFENDRMIIDAQGIRRLSWEQILALGRCTEKIVGTYMSLEKPYLRLTASPDPNLVRPEHILRKSLKYIMNNYMNYKCNRTGDLSTIMQFHKQDKNINTINTKKYDWKYLEEQFRSIRQDLTVQGIKNAFTIEVYETNARLALENEDLGQFNQCQARLRELYTSLSIKFEDSNRDEFSCYYILYITLQNMKTDLIRIMSEVENYKQFKGVRFALDICSTLLDGNYYRYFLLSKSAPWKSKHLLNIFRSRQILIALTTITKSSRFINILTLQKIFCFDSKESCYDFLKEHNAVFTKLDTNEIGAILDCKSSGSIFSTSPLLLSRKIQALG
ncbi:SAC3 GANP family protein [Cryptosporidium andersoni]|uniref:SAC3 GANP family protein n=1 Tax=Cryptosporidium andersoni TaxID=117008 RepID=A0A1J4MC04_9CRYT|nr:SAC3 GANP family protein [Cryptosporidium andersoni]